MGEGGRERKVLVMLFFLTSSMQSSNFFSSAMSNDVLSSLFSAKKDIPQY